MESKIKGNTGDRAKKITVKLWGKGVVEKNDFGGSEHTQYYIRKSGQFIYSKLDFLNAAFGVIPENLDEYESTADLPAFDLLNMNPYFLLYRVIQEDFYLKNGTIADGSRKAKRIHVDTFLKMSLNVPSLIEQERIKDCLITVDNLITLHQRKQKLLKNHYFYKNFHEKHENNNNKGEDTMRSLKLYHGSNVAVREPKLFPTARALDFGAGFYLTTSYEQAKKWAELMVKRRRTGVPTVSVYEVNEEQWSELSVLKFNAPNVEWLKFVSANRRNQHMEENWDVVVGPVANDNTMPVINLYLKGSYDEEEALKRLLPQKLKDQYAFKTEKAISKLQLCEVIMV